MEQPFEIGNNAGYIIQIFIVIFASKEHIVSDFFNRITALFKRCVNCRISASSWYIAAVAATLFIVLGGALLSFVIDPHYRYRLPVFYKTVYHQAYATAPRLLRDSEYDLLMIGSSMVRNFFLDDIERSFKMTPIKISASGATSYDLKKLFDTALDAKGDKLKKVIYSFDVYALNKRKPHYKDFEFMYRKDHWEDYRYLFDRQTFSSMLYLYKRVARPKGKRKYQAVRNRMFSTEHDRSRYSMTEVIGCAREYERIRHTQTPCIDGSEAVLQSEVLAMIDRNPQIEFTVFLPPYHLYSYCLSERFGQAEELLKLKTVALKELVKRKNVRLYDFQCDPEIVCNGAYYTDIQHYSSALCRTLLDEMRREKYHITSAAEVERNEAQLRKLIRDNMPAFYRDLGRPEELSARKEQ